MATICLLLVPVALLVSAGVCAVVLAMSGRLGLLDVAGSEAHKAHGRAVPNTGGVGVFWGLMLPLGIGVAWAAGWPEGLAVAAGAWLGEGAVVAAREHAAGVASVAGSAGVLGLALVAMHAMGLIDDRRPLGPWQKLGVQVAVASGVVLLTDTRALAALDDWLPGGVGYAASVAVSVLWVVVIANAMNMLDNMDGLSGGVGAIAAGVFLAANLLNGQWFIAALAAGLLGATLGFLVFNFPRAKLFMGDGGSLVLGLTLAVIALRTTYFDPSDRVLTSASDRWYGVLMPLLVLAVPLYDFVSVVGLRLWQGRHPFVGDRQHFSHRIEQRGFSRTAAVVMIWLIAAATGMGGVILGRLEAWQAVVVAGQSVALIALLAIAERGGDHARGD